MTTQSPSPAIPPLTRLLRSILVYALAGASTGLFAWGLLYGEKLRPYVDRNLIPDPDRRVLMMLMVGFALALPGLGLVALRARGLGRMERLGHWLAPLIVVGTFPFLANYKLWLGHELTFLVLTAGVALGLRALMAFSLADGLLDALSRQLQKVPRVPYGPTIFACLCAAFYAVYFSIGTVTNHYNFGTSAFDLGIETHVVWNVIHGEPLFRTTPLGGPMNHLGFHQTFFSFIVGIPYAIVPRAETLLVVQSVFLGAAAVPLFLVARMRVGEWTAAVLSLLFIFYGPLHGSNLYDFHYQPFSVFFVLLLAYVLESNRRWWVVGIVVLLFLSVREDMGAMIAIVGGYYLLSGRRPKAGLIVAAVGATVFVVHKMIIMPRFMGGQSSYAHIYKLLVPPGHQGFGPVIKTLVGNPAYTLSTILTEAKLRYVLELFVPLALFPLRRSIALVLLIPGFLFTLLSTEYPATIMTSFQYTAYWTPMIFLTVIHGLEDVMGMEAKGTKPRGTKVSWMVAMTAAMLFTSARFGVILQSETARGAFDPVRFTSTEKDHKNHEDFMALKSQIPADAKVVASEWLISHLVNRRSAYTLRNGVMDADYILFWMHPTKFRPDERPVLRQALFGPKAEFGVVERKGMFVLAQRGHSKKQNRKLRAKIR